MTSSVSPPASPPAVELRERDTRCLAEALSEFQQGEPEPCPPQLPAVLSACSPLFDYGCCWSASFWAGELQVALRYGAAEITSHHAAPLVGYSTTAARMLAGLVGLPLLEAEPIEVVAPIPLQQTAEPWNDPVQPPVVAPVVICPPPETAAAPAPAPAPEPAAAPAPAPAPEPAPAPDPAPAAEDLPLTAQEMEVAADMIRDMPIARRKAFSQAFRQAFAVPADAKQVRPYITHRRHLEFCDRYSVEAAGGISP